jgi:hypothetical protein
LLLKLSCRFKEKTMNKYNAFLTVFIVSVVALIAFLIFYFSAIFGFAFNVHEYDSIDQNPIRILSSIFTPEVIISGFAMAISSLLYRIMGIVYVARNKTVSDGEKALWIIGFIIMGFVTAIVFLIMAKGRKFVD